MSDGQIVGLTQASTIMNDGETQLGKGRPFPYKVAWYFMKQWLAESRLK